MSSDSSIPPPSEPPRFDSAQNAWILTRYQDVAAALRESCLWPVDGKREIQPTGRDPEGRIHLRSAMLEAIAGPRVEAWRPPLADITRAALDRVPANRS